MLLSQVTIVSCVTKPKNNVTLPPEPQRQEMAEAETVEDMVNMLNYYEHLVQEWEQWGEDVKKLIE